MIERIWRSENQRILICIDSYENGNPRGRLYNSYTGDSCFDSLSQLLIKAEEILDDLQTPQSYTTHRTFSHLVEPMEQSCDSNRVRKGDQATFELRVIFRQHTSWQGVIHWLEEKQEQSFRSVLEMILLMDSALRGLEGRVSA